MMLPGLILTLVAALVVLAATALIAFLRAAFWGEQDLAEQAQEVLRWRPPFSEGGALRDWAMATTTELVRRRLTGRRTGETVVQLAAELEAGAGQAMLPLARPAERDRIVPCSEAAQERVGVTVPEALAIAAHLRQHGSRIEQTRVHELAAQNARRSVSRSSGVGGLLQAPCPLRARDGQCRAHAVQPLCCRLVRAKSVAASLGGRSAPRGLSPAENPTGDRHEQTVARGIQMGLHRGLTAVGLDAKVYELNSILAAALETPDAAERWANGEEVFAGCARWGCTADLPLFSDRRHA